MCDADPANHEFHDAASGNVLTDVCPDGELESIDGVAVSDCRATPVAVQGGVQLYSLRDYNGGSDKPLCGASVGRRLGEQHRQRVLQLLTEGTTAQCCSDGGSCMPAVADC